MLVSWEIDPEFIDKFLTHVLPPTLAERTAHIAGLGITSYLTSAAGGHEEAQLLCVLQMAVKVDDPIGRCVVWTSSQRTPSLMTTV